MGRYYSGDIEGKFWFAVQSSDASERFRGQAHEPQYTEYHFDKEDDLDDVEKEIEVIEDSLGEYKQLFDDFFEENGGYNTEKLLKYFAEKGSPLTKDVCEAHLSDYADLGLGIQIRDCLIEEGYCCFSAEH